ncbi:MAG: ATPase [Treponema sp.]|nr:ATPase [Treponema sp.]
MIEPMKKVSIVILDKERENALRQLRKIGLVHLEKIEGSSEKLTAYKETLSNIIVTESVLGEIKLPKTSKVLINKISNDEVVNLCKDVVTKSERKKQLFEEISSDVSELERFQNWGSVNLDDFQYLDEKGISLKMFEIPIDKYSQLDEKFETILVNNDKKIVRFLLINSGKERPESLLPEAFEIPLPRLSTEILENEISSYNKEIDEIEDFFRNKAIFLKNVSDYKRIVESDIEFENVNSGMYRENLKSENDLAWISGFVPEEDLSVLQKACVDNKWALAFDDPAADDVDVPTKLKNNKFVSLIYPLTDFLGTVPGYHEYDISVWFLFFFTIFFGMIFGDGGYGILVTIVALIMIIKNSMSKKSFSPLLGLILLLGIATIVWGTVTCNWFGLTMEYIPNWLKNISIPFISNAYSDLTWAPFWDAESQYRLTSAQNMQIFCFMLALFQLSVAHIKGMKSNIKSLKFFGELGSLLQLIGMFYVVLSMVVSSNIFSFGLKIYGIPVGTVAISLIVFGFALSFIFSNYSGNVAQSILESCKNIISVLLGVVNVFSDIVSYIRLWAVGLAGAAISNTVNEMAGPLLGHFITFIAFVALICFGHGLNMILNLLSVIVHGVRLNTLEFSTHLGMSWSGFKYSPFFEKTNK